MTRLTLGLSSPNVLAAVGSVLSVALPALIQLATRCHVRIGPFIGYSLAAAMSMAMASSASRGGLLAALAGLAVVAGMSPPRMRRPSLIMIALLLMGAFALPAAMQRWVATAPGQPSIATRFYLWRTASIMAYDQRASGIGDADFGLACVTMRAPPDHLRGDDGNSFSSALNDPLDEVIHLGAMLATAVIALHIMPVATGVLAWRAGAAEAGPLLAGAGVAWFAAGQASCIWHADAIATSLAWTAFAVIALPNLRYLAWRPALHACSWSLALAGVMVAGLLLAGLAFADRVPRLVADHGPLPWRLEPRRPARGQVVYLRGAEESVAETLRYALRTVAEDGYSVSAADRLDAMVAMPAGTVMVARGDRAGEALVTVEEGRAAVAVLLDPTAALAGRKPMAAAIIAIHGDKAAEADRKAWMAACGQGRAAEVACGRIWANRMPMVWPVAARLLDAVHPLP